MKSLRFGLDQLVCVICLFPYLSFLGLPVDVQPNFFIISSLYLLGGNLRLKPHQLCFLFLTLLALLVYGFSSIYYTEVLRYTVQLITPFLTLFFATRVSGSCISIRVIQRTINYSFIAWIFLGFLQSITSSPLIVLAFRSSTTLSRGWMSFAPEPSAFASVLLCFFLHYSLKRSYFLALLSALSIIFLSRSATGFVYLFFFLLVILGVAIAKMILAIGSLSVSRSKFFFLFVGVSASLVASTVFVYFFGSNLSWIDLSSFSRITSLFDSSIFELLEVDASASARVGVLYSTFTPELILSFGNGFDGLRVMSGYGSLFWHFGILGFVYLSFLLFMFTRSCANFFDLQILVFAILFSTIFVGPVLFTNPLPTFLFWFSILAYCGRRGGKVLA